jgi:hypothetical protein
MLLATQVAASSPTEALPCPPRHTPQDWFCQCFKPSQAAVEAAEAQRAEKEARVRLVVRRARLLVEVLESQEGVCRVAQLAAQEGVCRVAQLAAQEGVCRVAQLAAQEGVCRVAQLAAQEGVCRVAQLAAQAQGAIKPPSLFGSMPGVDRVAAGVLMAAGGGAGRGGAIGAAAAAVAQREQQAWQAQRVLLQKLASDMNMRHWQLQSLVDKVLRADVGAVEVMLLQVWHVAEQQQDGAERAKATHRAMMAGR